MLRPSLVLLAVLALLGCGSSDDSSSTPGSGGSPNGGSGGKATGGDSGRGGAGASSGNAGAIGNEDSGAGGTAGSSADSGTPYQRQHLIFESTWEEPAPLDQWSNTQHCCDYSVQVSTEQARAGTHSVRFEVHDDDPWVSSGVRSEIVGGPDVDSPTFERWYGVSFYLPSAWVIDAREESVIQWHHHGGGSPPMSLWMKGDKWLMVHTTDGVGSDFAHEEVGQVETGAWTDFVFHIAFDPTPNGRIELFQNGIKVYDYTGPTNYDDTNYMKVGVYKWPWMDPNSGSIATERVMFMDEMRIGDALATFADVASDP